MVSEIAFWAEGEGEETRILASWAVGVVVVFALPIFRDYRHPVPVSTLICTLPHVCGFRR